MVDPVGDCAVKAEKGTATLTVPGPNRGLGGTSSGTQQAPRLLQEVQGDFSVTVKVTGDFDPAARGAKNAFKGAGLLIWAKEREFIRVQRNIWVTPDGRHSSYIPLIEYWKDGFNTTSRPGSERAFWQGRSTFLRVIRKADEFSIGVSHDGTKWLDMDIVTAKFPDKIKVGVAAINNSDKPFIVEFSEFRLASIPKNP